jgi:hypothetical protein
MYQRTSAVPWLVGYPIRDLEQSPPVSSPSPGFTVSWRIEDVSAVWSGVMMAGEGHDCGGPGIDAWVCLDHRSRSEYRMAAAVARNPGLTHNPGFSPPRHEAPNMDLNRETLGPSWLEDAAKTQRPAPGEHHSGRLVRSAPMWHRQLVHDAPDSRLSLSISRSFITASAEVASGHLLFRCEDAGHATSPRPGIHIISVFGWPLQLFL